MKLFPGTLETYADFHLLFFLRERALLDEVFIINVGNILWPLSGSKNPIAKRFQSCD